MKHLSSLAVRALCALGLIATAAAAHATNAGCPWIQAYSANGKGAIDTNAAYWSSLLPNNPKPGTTVQVDATYPQLRFFNFTIYHTGNVVDHLSDSSLFPLEGGAPDDNVAAVPYSNNYTDHYRLTIKYVDAPTDPGMREPNTLYAGATANQARVLIMRNYLANDGVDVKGGVSLPQLTQINPDGTTLRYDQSSPNLACPILQAIEPAVFWFTLPTPGIATKTPTFAVVAMSQYNNSGINLFPAYANLDSGYGYLTTAPQFGDLLLIRTKMPATPGNTSDPSALDTRYFSVCEYQSTNRLILGCLDDRQAATQSDGYATIVTSLASKRPALATPDNGYSWLPWPNATNKTLFIIRQILARPDFAGNYQIASGASDPLATLGDWAPLATYCSSATFNANAASGGAAVFAACQADSQKVTK